MMGGSRILGKGKKGKNALSKRKACHREGTDRDREARHALVSNITQNETKIYLFRL